MTAVALLLYATDLVGVFGLLTWLHLRRTAPPGSGP